MTECYILTIHANGTVAMVTMVAHLADATREVMRVMGLEPIDHVDVDHWQRHAHYAAKLSWPLSVMEMGGWIQPRPTFKWTERPHG